MATDRPITIGRYALASEGEAIDSAITLYPKPGSVEERSISQTHAELSWNGTEYVVKAKSDKAPTTVWRNGDSITVALNQAVPLQPDDKLYLSPSVVFLVKQQENNTWYLEEAFATPNITTEPPKQVIKPTA